ncbi:hypothetical protein LCGC14_0295860 [marine sediment metagenome]|uniref:Uncharacterized protein n=1 Tax=marine sediment metagenome TaxID=412755 RepID=A0A0F9WD62_9ZZZZ|nr:hypothetical protein [Phycisphaerae bacterium]HDZ44173.1 hypothetical protein [Phycisphaerae bacterium]
MNANEQSTKQPGTPSRWVLVALLGVIAAGLLIELGRATAAGPGDLPGESAGATPSMMAVTGQITRDGYGIYLVDLNSRTICIYQYVSTQRKLRLLAARTFAFDTQLDDYNTEPSPREIRDLVSRHPRLTDRGPPVVEPDSPGPQDDPTDPMTQPDGDD